MKKNTVFLLFLLLLTLVLLTSCGGGAGEEPALTQDAPESQTPASELDDEKGSAETPDREPGPESRESEQAFFHQLAGGFFYTDHVDTPFGKARVEAMDVLNRQMDRVRTSCRDLYENGLGPYEDKLQEAIDTNGGGHESDVQVMIDDMIKHKVLIEATTAELRGYREKTEVGEPLEVTQASIDQRAFAKTHDLYEMTGAYLSFLNDATAYVTSVMITDDERAESLRQEMNTLFRESVAKKQSALLSEYLVMSNIYVHIASSDYYDGMEIREATRQRLADQEATEVTEGLKALVTPQMTPPDYLVEVGALSGRSIPRKRPFLLTVYADDDLDTLSTKLALLGLVEQLENVRKVYGSVSQDDYDEALFDMFLNQKAIKDALVKEHSERGRASHASDTPTFDEWLREWADDHATTEVRGQIRNVPAIAHNLDAVEQELISQEKRAEMIEKLQALQESKEGKAAQEALSWMPSLSGDAIYNQMIGKFSKTLEDNEGKMEGETFAQLNTLLEEDLAQVLGDHKVDFANKILTTKADELVNTFADWVNASKNLKNLEINRSTLVSLLDQMGVPYDAQAVAEDPTVEDGPSEEETEEDTTLVSSTNREVLMDFLSYMLPLMDNINYDEIQEKAAERGLEAEELYVYSMSILLVGTEQIFTGDETSEEKDRLMTELSALDSEQKPLSPWADAYVMEMFYELFNERGDLDRWKTLDEQEKIQLVRNYLEG